MYFVALATDFDDTIAEHGHVDPATLEALHAVKRSGRKLLLVTGRELSDLLSVFPHVSLFDLVVVENGATLYDPDTREETLLAETPNMELLARLRQARLTPLSAGRSIIATRQPNEVFVLEVIRELGLEAQIIFNRGAVMVLPPGVNKASGLDGALERLALSAHNIVGVGDAENDHAFLQACGCRVAVANAVDALKLSADFVTTMERGAGVTELTRLLIETDMESVGLMEHAPLLGQTIEGSPVRLSREEGPLLVLGASGGGKSTIIRGIIERLVRDRYQCLIIDPEGDHAELENVTTAGGAKEKPQADTVLGNLKRKPEESVAVSLIAIDADSRPGAFANLFSHVTAMRGEVGRPHWLIIDEVHHVMPANWGPALPSALPATVAVTADVKLVAQEFLMRVGSVLAIGSTAGAMIKQFCRATDRAVPADLRASTDEGCGFLLDGDGHLHVIRIEPPKEQKRRHTRKYAEGELDQSFCFRGPANKLNLKAQNLVLFQQMAEGVDDETWLFHLAAGDYSRWLEETIKDPDLARTTRHIERDYRDDARESRRLVCEEISKRYTVPARAG